jgi:tetratricopeptide (TPR) repeat protein
MLEAHPQDFGFLGFRAYVIARQGDLDGARAMLDSYHNTEFASAFAETYALLGMVEEAEARLDQFDDPGHHWMPTAYARIALILGQEERALDYIEAAAEDSPRLMAMMLCPDDTGPLQDNPRFAAILAQAGMPVTVAATR